LLQFFIFRYINLISFNVCLYESKFVPYVLLLSPSGFNSTVRHRSHQNRFCSNLISDLNLVRSTNGFATVSDESNVDNGEKLVDKKPKIFYKKPIDFTKIDANLLPTVMLMGRPNVGKSALYNRLVSSVYV